MAKSPDAFRTISEVAEWLDTPAHVLRFWESRFSQVKPVKRAGGRRYYRPTDMQLLGGIKQLLHEDGMTIRGVQKLLKKEGVKHVAAFSQPLDVDVTDDVAAEPATEPADAPLAEPPETTEPLSRDTVSEPAPDPSDVEEEAPMTLDVEPEPLDNLVQMSEPSTDLNVEHAADGEADPAPDQTPTAAMEVASDDTPEPLPPLDAEQVASEPDTDDLAGDMPAAVYSEETETAAQSEVPDPAPATPMFQSSHRAAAVPPVDHPSDDTAAVTPTAPEVTEPPAPTPLGADIPNDPETDAAMAGAPTAPVANIITLTQAMRKSRAAEPATQMDDAEIAPVFQLLVELRDRLRAKG